MNKYKSVYISISGVDPEWIVGKISEDIQLELNKRGIICNYGPPENYNGEDICHHMGWAYAKPILNAKINSVFITHIDDSLKERLLKFLKNKFDFFLTMSKEDKDFLIQLGFDKKKTFGLTLPVRNNFVKPLSLGIFSSYYEDGRKNEKWLLDFLKNHKDSRYLNFVFIGPNWGKFINKLEKINISFEWHFTSNLMPYEYDFQKNKLSNLDYYFYIGMDGGAMGSYDGYAYGNKLLITDNCYHKEIPNVDYLINNYEEFFQILKKISKTQKEKINFFANNKIENYVNNLLSVWDNSFKQNYVNDLNKNILKKRRSNYFNFSIRRFLGAIKRILYRILK